MRILICFVTLNLACLTVSQQALAACSSIGLGQPRTDKARYNPGKQVVISLTVTNGTASACSTSLDLQLLHLEERLENAAMFASGATQIQVGDDVQVLSHEYFPNHFKSVSPALRRALERQYDFITAYENALFDEDVVARERTAG